MNKSRILIVDDDEDMRFLISMWLGRDYEVTELSEGLEALDCIKQSIPDMVILDLNLPGTDGTEILERIRSDEVIGGTKVIILSGEEDSGRLEKLWSLHPDAVVSKETGKRGLIEAVSGLLQGSDL